MSQRTYLLAAVAAVVLATVLGWPEVFGRSVRAQPTAPAQRVDFTRDIRPILSDNCFTCHGPDDKQRMAGLRLDLREGALGERKGGPIIVPGDPARSKLYQRISSEDPAFRMPFMGKKLTSQQIALIRQWIEQGAEWETHWAYIPPKRAELPKVKNKTWPRNPIDDFVLARLEKEGLKPSPEADKTTLLRRVTLDLTGLPPTLAEVDAFLADHSPGAYEKVVDRLLQSPHYGERMAMHWLDLARYADTHGYHIDSHRDMWHWRDWVIEAFSRNLPFDQFTIWQLAGDLLPNASREQRLATGFNRNHMINFEGGAIPDEYLVEYVVDRVETTSTVWMGLTLGCGRCHDHKYDPIQQKEFYEFFAFFNNVPEKGLDGRRGNAEPVLELTTDEQQQRLRQLERAILSGDQALSDEKIGPLQSGWEKTRLETLPQAPREALLAHYEFDNNLSDVSGHYRHGRVLRGEVTYAEGPLHRSAVLSGETHLELGGSGSFDSAPFDSHSAFSIATWIRSNGTREMVVLQKTDPAGPRRGFEILFEDSFPVPDLKRAARLVVRLIHRWPDDAIEVRTKEPLVLTAKEGEARGSWHHVAINYAGSGQGAGLKLYVDARPAAVEVLRDRLTGSIRNDSPLSSGDKALGHPWKGQFDDLRIYNRPLSEAEIEQLAVHEPIRSILWPNGPADKRTKTQKTILREYFLTRDAPENLRKLYADLNERKAERERLEKIIPTTMVMSEREKPRETFILGRGDYRNKTVKVQPGVPAVLPPLPAGAPRNRLGLARWLVDAAHPLTARVTVNRFWQMYFGTGLVKTAEDFGSRGEPPSHPELLDWLATEFIRTGWDMRAMQRLVVTSATYRQSSRATPALIEKDPENRLLARGPRFRLPAEMVRDNALAASGLLNTKIGGPGVFPYQPKGLWEEISYGDVYSAQYYTPSRGEDLHRRSMYTFWKRTSPPPSLAVFDAPDREKCTARRARTNTPLQALALMNDPTYVEASRALAQRVLLSPARGPAERIGLAFRLATSRAPEAKELQVLQDLARQQLLHYRRDPGAAAQLLQVGESRPDPKLDRAELAAWTTVASVILNLDETITKE